jgi:hypothetical protein
MHWIRKKQQWLKKINYKYFNICVFTTYKENVI